jgi:succinoglycan biosynthesis transport protein ExoP
MMEANGQPNPQPQGQPIDEEPIDLRKYWEIFLKRKWTILAVFVLVVGVVGVYTLRQPKIYSATATLIIDLQAPQVLGGEVREAIEVGTTGYWYNKEFYETQYRIIKSRAIAERVVEQLGLRSDFAFLGVDKLPPDKRGEVLQKLDAVEVLQRRLFVEPVKDSRVVQVRVEDRDPERAARLANTVAEAYMQANLERRVEGTKDATEWLQDQLADLKTRLSESELALHSFKEQNDLIYTTLENRQTITSQKLIAINDTLTRIKTKKAELDARVKSVRVASQSGDINKVMQLGVVANNAFINDLKKTYSTTLNEVADLAERYGPEHPKMKAAQEKLENARKSLMGEIDAIIAANLAEFEELVETEKNLMRMLEEVKRESFEVNKKEIDYKRLAREEENNQRLYELVLKRMKELDLSSLLKTNNIRVLDSAKVKRVPVKPRVQVNLALAAILGLIGGIGLAFIIEVQDRSIKSHEDFEALGIGFLGLIPTIPGNEAKPTFRDLYVLEQPTSNVAELCRTIRTNMLLMRPDNPPKRILVTSVAPQEGKTTTVINLGVTLALAGARVLIVDSDMRRPRIHSSFNLKNEVGLSSVIVGDSRLEESVRCTDVPGLWILPSGPVPPNPVELLHSVRFQELARQLGEEFDRILFDSPPVGAVTDALVLANELEGTILVAKALRTAKPAAERVVKALQGAGARFLGGILNDLEVNKKFGYYFGSYYGYGRYVEEPKTKA